jgi:PKD repeat protein
VEQDMWPINNTQTFVNYFESHGIEQASCNGITAAFSVDDSDVCPGTTVSFTDESNGEGITAWTWTFEGGDPETSTEQNPSVVYNTPGLWDVTLAITSEESSDTLTIDDFMEVFETPDVTLDAFEVACVYWEPYALTGGMPEGGVYSGDGVTDGIFDPEEAGIGDHVITYTYTSDDGCENSSEQTLTVDECTGIDETNQGDVKIYPNPANDFVTVTSKTEISSLKVYSYTGRLLTNISVNNYSYRLNTAKYAAGVYSVITKTSDDKTTSKRLIIR